MNRILHVALLVSLLSACSADDDSGPAAGQPDANPPGDSGVPPQDGSTDSSSGKDGGSGEDGGATPGTGMITCLGVMSDGWDLPVEGTAADDTTVSPANLIDAPAYQDFNEFCRDSFGQQEPLTLEVHGNKPGFRPPGHWIYPSRNSAAIGFETNLPTLSFVEFGTSETYGQRTPLGDRYTYLHLHYLKGLEPNRTYHYRLVGVDERGKTVQSSDRTFDTPPLSGAIDVPGSLSGPPYVLDQPDKVYVVTQDITSDTRAFTIDAAGVTLDLNGFTITYDQGTPLVTGEWDAYVYSDQSSFGVMSSGGIDGSRILNGTIVQGASQSQGHISIGFNPIYLSSSNSVEVAGITAQYGGHSVGGILLRYGDFDVHHNVVIDTGTGIDNRHQGIKALLVEGEGSNVHRNLIKRTRQQGLSTRANSIANEVYVDSWDTNSMGILPGPNTVIESNRVFGTGYHAVGIGWSLADENESMTYCNNFVHMQGDVPTNRSDEYGSQASVNGFRLTQYNGSTKRYNNYVYEGNTVIVKGRNGTSVMRGTQFFSDPYVVGLIFRANIVKTEVLDDETTSEAACVVGHGNSASADVQLPVRYENNRFISNRLHVRFGDDYAGGGNHQFRWNTFEKIGSRPDYHMIQMGYWTYPSYGNLFIDSETLGGADLEDSEFTGSASVLCDYAVGHSLHVILEDGAGTPLGNRTIAVQDSSGTTFTGTTDADGRARLELLEYTYRKDAGQSNATKILHADHEVLVDGMSAIPLSQQQLEIRDNEENPLVLVASP